MSDLSIPFEVEAEARRWTSENRRDALAGRVAEWTEAHPEPPTADGPRFDRAAGMFRHAAELDEAGWVAIFDNDPDLMWRIVGDIVRYVSSEETPRGQRLSGQRRVRPEDRNLAAVWRIISPRFSMDPFPVAFAELRGKRSLRAFAMKCGCPHYTLTRYVEGKRSLTMEALEMIAAGGRVEPHYFVEYRAMWIAREIERLYVTRPNLSLRALKDIRAAVV